MASSKKLCPFCGHGAFAHESAAAGHAWFQCGYCSARGPLAPDISQARKAWAKREVEK